MSIDQIMSIVRKVDKSKTQCLSRKFTIYWGEKNKNMELKTACIDVYIYVCIVHAYKFNAVLCNIVNKYY